MKLPHHGLRRALEHAASVRRREWVVVVVALPSGFLPVWEHVLGEAAERGMTHPNPRVAAGMAVEMLAAEYLAS